MCRIDPTAWITDHHARQDLFGIGIAHGSIRGFSEGDAPSDIIAPDRDRQARLDCLALGDWHGDMKVSDRCYYSGAPERTHFRHDGAGVCLVVSIAAPGAVPKVERQRVGQLEWRQVELDPLPTDDPEAMLTARLHQGPRRNRPGLHRADR